MIRVVVQEADFDAGAELLRLQGEAPGAGAVASFIGIVRPESAGEKLVSMTLEHYPGMTERALEDIARAAAGRWALDGVTVIHRVGVLLPGAQIVLVATASAHRQSAFDAAQHVMDYLKTRAPFWKLEQRASGSSWVDARSSDEDAAARWEQT